MASRYLLNGREVTEEEFFGNRADAERRFNEMIGCGTPPGANTDREFLRGHVCGNQFEGNERMGDSLKAIAESEGQSVTGKVYLGSLARYPGDPQAWVNGRGDVKKVCESRGWGCEGSVSVAPQGVERLPRKKASKVPLAARLHKAGLPMASSWSVQI